MSRRILVIEDNRDLADLVRLHLSDLPAQVDVAADGASGLARAQRQRYDLVVLDLMLPGLDGLEVCRRLRESGSYTPILMLTAKSSEMDRVLGLELGADDYLTKPFSLPELVARVKAIFRRVEALAAAPEVGGLGVIERDGLSIDCAKRKVSVEGKQVDLTSREFDLLVHFALHPGRVYKRAQLLDQVWGHGYEGYEHTVNSHINRLRAKIEKDPASPRYIQTVWGVGYRFAEANS